MDSQARNSTLPFGPSRGERIRPFDAQSLMVGKLQHRPQHLAVNFRVADHPITAGDFCPACLKLRLDQRHDIPMLAIAGSSGLLFTGGEPSQALYHGQQDFQRDKGSVDGHQLELLQAGVPHSGHWSLP